MNERFARAGLILGEAALETLERSRVIVFGIGGVGGYVCEALARSGVGALDLVDHDVVSLSNVNRQIIAATSTVGQPKVQVMAARIADINPDCRVVTHECMYLPSTADQFDFADYDYVVDAVDTVTAKLQLIKAAHEAGTPLISCMGTANKLDPCAFRVDDIDKTSICPLARIIRKEARKRGLGHFKVVYSTEPALVPEATDEEPPQGRRSIPGSVAFVPPAAGFALAGEVVRDLVAGATLGKVH